MMGVPTGWEWIAANDYNPDEGIDSVVVWLPYLVNSELLEYFDDADWRVCDASCIYEEGQSRSVRVCEYDKSTN